MANSSPTPEVRAAVARLTERQKDCLRLVPLRDGSKGIGQVLGISHHVVDKHLKAAMKTFDVSSRFEAARLLGAVEACGPPLVPQSPDLPRDDDPASQLAAVEEREQQLQSGSRSVVREEQAVFHAVPPHPSRGFGLPIPTRERPRNELTPWGRIAWMIALLVLLIFAIGFFVMGAEGLGRIFLNTSL